MLLLGHVGRFREEMTQEVELGIKRSTKVDLQKTVQGKGKGMC